MQDAPLFSATDEYWMRRALELAHEAQNLGEVPVGAVLVQTETNAMLGEGFNQPINLHDPTAHAELMAIRAAAQKQKNYRLPNSTLYVTLEPCSMCAGALLHARVTRVVIATHEPRAGAAGSQINLLQADWSNHACQVSYGLLQAESSNLLKAFFRARR